MALCKEFNQANEIANVARYIVENIPQEKLELYAKFSKAFKKGGFRLGNIRGIRSQIVRLIESNEIIEEPLRKLLAEYSQCSRVFQLLSEDVILEHKKEFEVFFGGEQILFAALLDPRENIRKEAISAFSEKETQRKKDEHEEGDFAWARSRLGELIWPLLNSFGTTDKNAPAMSTSGNFAVEQELKDLRSKAKKLERVEKQLQIAEEKKQSAENETRRYAEKAENSEKQAAAARNRAENAEAELERNKKNARNQAEAIIQTRIAKEFAKWFGGTRSEKIEQILPEDFFSLEKNPSSTCPGEKDFKDLVEKTRKALMAQAHADTISGVRSVFEQRLVTLEKLLRNCNESLTNAMRPTEALISLRKELEEACNRLRAILHPDLPDDTHVFDSLAIAINTAPDRQLPEWTHIADKLDLIGLLSKENHQTLLDIIHRRYATVHLQGTRELREEDLEDPKNILRLGLRGRLAVSLLIDGHNVLFALQSRYARPQDHHFPSKEARQWLLDDVVQMFSQSPSCRAILGYDGPERSELEAAANVRMIYSGGEGEHRADKVLVDEARFIVRNDPDQHLLLVTNDQDLAKEASRLGVGNLAPTDLLEHFS